MNTIISLYNKLTTPSKLIAQDGITYWQDKLLLKLIFISVVMGLFAYISSISLCIKKGYWAIVFIDTIIYTLLLILLLNKHLPFIFRAVCLPVMIYSIGLVVVITLGPFGDGPVWLFCFPVLTGVLLGHKKAFMALILNGLTIIVLVFLLYFSLTHENALISSTFTMWQFAIDDSLERWIAICINFMCLNIITTFSVTTILSNLEKSNNKLQSTLKEKEKTEKNLQKSELQLIQAQKMEAIGSLAGGVAHDLNNIISAQLIYPELILMDLPDDSPLRKPLITIRESGEKAAAIIQDLLTMARRGVIISNVVNLNKIIENYLDSPEFKRIKEFHPDIIIQKNLSEDLFNIMGSNVHLFKTIMNLINNAAEAMPHGGDIFITTQNKTINKPLKTNILIKEGDYTVLTITDGGTGIAPNDINRIFEPFYTKKMMGKSGTGLGMAVVLGTVQDHKGYIDVQSTIGKGTTFILYFPLTRKKIEEENTALSLEDYKGNGESILIVDDVKQQRKIASEILKKLGYEVSSAESGEKAIEYLKKKSVDLIILDMIMDPGINGCETYKQILKLHPEQKAVITSGFANTKTVQETLKLGAGVYIKKPYTLEKISLAIKNELAR